MPNHKKVISFPSEWRFFDYLEGTNNPIEGWYQGLSEDEGQDTLNGILKVNKKAPRPTDWISCKMLQGKYKEEGIWEWRFVADGRQQRLLGIFGDNRKEAIFLIGCTHKQQVYSPADCLDTALRRAKVVREKKARLRERQVKSDI